jgi:hypothetical protein
MSDDPRRLTAEARRIAAECERYMEAAVEFVRALPEDRQRAEERMAAARERRRRASEELDRLFEDENADERELDRAEREYHRAWNAQFRLSWYRDTDETDPEHRKAVARQMAGLAREDSDQKLREIARRTDDPEVRKAVAEYREDVARAARYVENRFRKARDLPVDEVRKARVEATEILEHFRNGLADP